MPRRLKPHKEHRANGVYWVVSLGKKYTGASRQRRYFRNRKEANGYVLQCEKARQKLGHEAFALPMELRAEALVCNERLKALCCTLTQAVDFFILNKPSNEAAKSLYEIRDEFIRSRKAMNCRPRTVVQYESYLRIICSEFGKSEVVKLFRQDIEDWLEESDWSHRTRKNYLVTLTTLLNFAVKKGYSTDNPAENIERPILDDRPIGILNVQQVKSLLRSAQESDVEMVPALAIGLFAGLRRSEFFALDWSEVDLENQTIEVKGIKAKTRQRRLVHVQENLREWLVPHRKNKGPIAPEQNIDMFAERLKALAEKAAIKPWPHNAMRHSFGSYFFAKTKDENLTASEMGNSPGVVFRHYRALVRDVDTVAYWGILPTHLAELIEPQGIDARTGSHGL